MSTSADDTQRSDRISTAVRLGRAGLVEIDAMARAEERSRSAMIRILLREAVQARRGQRTR